MGLLKWMSVGGKTACMNVVPITSAVDMVTAWATETATVIQSILGLVASTTRTATHDATVKALVYLSSWIPLFLGCQPFLAIATVTYHSMGQLAKLDLGIKPGQRIGLHCLFGLPW